MRALVLLSFCDIIFFFFACGCLLHPLFVDIGLCASVSAHVVLCVCVFLCLCVCTCVCACVRVCWYVDECDQNKYIYRKKLLFKNILKMIKS
jgi:hypothetical protein